jgi:hypothetical protein
VTPDAPDELAAMREYKRQVYLRYKYHLYDWWPRDIAIEMAAADVNRPISYVRRVVESHVA